MLQRFRLDDRTFLDQIGVRLAEALCRAGELERGLLSVTLAVPEIPFGSLPASLHDMFYWSRPAARHNLLGLGTAVAVEASGVERWCRLKDAFAGWRTLWRHEDGDGTGLRPLALGGFSFSPEACATELPAARLAVPALLLRRAGELSALTFTFSAADGGIGLTAALQNLERLAQALAAQPPCPAAEDQPLSRQSCEPEDTAWLARVAEAVADIQSGLLDKVVLTRRVTLNAERDFDPGRIMAELARRYPRCTLFGLETAGGGVFLGASPELLAGLHHGDAYCDALAGTAWNACDAGLLGGVKNGREHRLVVQAVAEALRPVCSRLEVPAAPVALHLGNLRHLRSTLRGRVKAGVGLLDLLERLHPTPAVGGYPCRAALDWLAQHHETRAHWYTGAVGWMDSAGEGEFAVALRCASVHGSRAHLYVGAGIVAGSDPKMELAETEAKLGAMLGALGHA